MENVFDVVIIGGGPVGLRVALSLQRANLRVLVLEAKSRVGYPNHCSGLVPTEFIKIGEVKDDLILNYIKGGVVYSFKENTFLFKRDIPYAAVIDRTNFDIYTEKLAKSASAKIIYNAYAKEIKKEKENIIVKLNNGDEYLARVLVVATGAANAIQSKIGVELKSETIYTVQVDGEVSLKDYEVAYIYMNNRIATDWFAWIIPTKDGFARIGFGTSKGQNILKNLDDLFSEWSLLKNARIVSKPVVWSIPIGIPRRIVFDNILFVGDSARQVKPFSGGGLLTGFISADELSKAVIKAFNVPSKYFYKALSSYESSVREKLYKEFRRELILRDIYKTLSDESKDKIIRSIKQDKVVDVLLKFGVMDKPSITGLKLLKEMPLILLLYIKDKLKV